MLFLAGAFACTEKEQGSESVPVEFTEYSLEGTECQWKNLNQSEKVIIINSNEDLRKYLTCTDGDCPIVDFSKYTLLLASGTSSAGIEALYSEWLSTTDKFVLNIEITQNYATVVDEWTVAFLVNKTEWNAQIDVEVKILTEAETRIPYVICESEDGYMDSIQMKNETWLFNDSVSTTFLRQSGYISWIVYTPENNTAIMHVSSTHYNIHEICNYPEFAKQWDVPLSGQKVYYEGIAYRMNAGYDSPLYKIVLTTFRKK